MKAQTTCNVCNRDPSRMNSDIAECSHIQCPHRRTAWSERPTHADLFRGPWPKPERDRDPEAVDRVEKMPRVFMAGRQCIDTGRLVIGSAYVPPPSPVFAHAERLQAALLDPRTQKEPSPLRRFAGRIWAWC